MEKPNALGKSSSGKAPVEQAAMAASAFEAFRVNLCCMAAVLRQSGNAARPIRSRSNDSSLKSL
jgi:hypothetical protein